MIGNLIALTADKFCELAFEDGAGKYLAVVSGFDDELKLRNLICEKAKELAKSGKYVFEELDYNSPRFQEYKVVAMDSQADRLLVQLKDKKTEVWYSRDELETLIEKTQNTGSKMDAKLPKGKTGIALYNSLNTDIRYISMLNSDCEPNNWIVFGILCEERPAEEVDQIWRSLNQPFAARVTV